MRSILRKLVLAPVVLAAAVVATNTAMAEVTLNVPFSFSVAGKQLPAGRYSVEKDINRGLVTLKSKASAKSFTWIGIPAGDGAISDKVILKFDEQGNYHTLASVQYGHVTTPRIDKKGYDTERVSMPIGQGR